MFFCGNVWRSKLGGRCPVKTLANHNKYLIIIVFGAACHINGVSIYVRFEQTDLLASQISSQRRPIQVVSHFSESQVFTRIDKSAYNLFMQTSFRLNNYYLNTALILDRITALNDMMASGGI